VARLSSRSARRWRAGLIARAAAAARRLALTESSSAPSSALNCLRAESGGSSRARSLRVLRRASPNWSNCLAIARLDLAETSSPVSSRVTLASRLIAAL
jgi:hypothetical protein